MGKIKHSKYKNTGLLYEILTRQIMIDTMDQKESKALAIVKRHFKTNSILTKENSLYNYLLTEKFKTESSSAHFVDAILESRKKLDGKTLSRKKYELIKDMREQLDIDSLFEYRIKNYRVLAAIYKMFEYAEADDPVTLSRSKATILEHVSHNSAPASVDIPEEFKDSDIRILTYKLLVDKINRTYNNKFNRDQKELLREYINSITNTPQLKRQVNERVDSVKKELSRLKTGVTSRVTKIKLNEITKMLDAIKNRRYVKNNDISTLLMYYELIDELKKTGDK